MYIHIYVALVGRFEAAEQLGFEAAEQLCNICNMIADIET